MFLVVGLGNPGSKYQNHRHNVGFMVVEHLAQRHRREPFREKFQGQFAKGAVEALEFGLLKPQTFMNLSGQSAQKAMAFFKVPLGNVATGGAPSRTSGFRSCRYSSTLGTPSPSGSAA